MEPLYVSIAEACRLVGIGRSKLYQLIGEGQVDTITIGRRRLVILVSLHALGNAPGWGDRTP